MPMVPKSFSILLLFLLPSWYQHLGVDGTKVHITGTVKCQGQPSAGAKVELWEDDFLADDLLGTTTTDPNGHFEVQGEQSELLHAIEPYLLVSLTSHKCNPVELFEKDCQFSTQVEICEKPDDQDLIKVQNLEINLNSTAGEILCDDRSAQDNQTTVISTSTSATSTTTKSAKTSAPPKKKDRMENDSDESEESTTPSKWSPTTDTAEDESGDGSDEGQESEKSIISEADDAGEKTTDQTNGSTTETSTMANVCNLPKDAGTSTDSTVRMRWYWNKAEKKCQTFLYKGTGGNANRFTSLADCNFGCQNH